MYVYFRNYIFSRRVFRICSCLDVTSPRILNQYIEMKVSERRSVLKCFIFMQDWVTFGAVVMRRLTGVDKNTNLFLPWNVFEFVNMPYLGILNREVIRINMRR